MTYPTYPFVNPLTNIFGDADNITSTPITIVETTTNPIIVYSIKIVNKGASDIRINLKQYLNVTFPTSVTTEAYREKDLLVPGYRNLQKGPNSVQLLKENETCVLSYSDDMNAGLICYSNGPTQFFDCVVTYVVINEIPV